MDIKVKFLSFRKISQQFMFSRIVHNLRHVFKQVLGLLLFYRQTQSRRTNYVQIGAGPLLGRRRRRRRINLSTHCLALCMLGELHAFLTSADFYLFLFEINFLNKSYRNTIRIFNNLDPYSWPDLDLNCSRKHRENKSV